MSKINLSNPDLRKEIESRVPKIGAAEWELACQAAIDAKNLGEFKRQVADALEAFGQKVTGPVSGLASFEYKSEQGWLDYYASIETAARKELLASSAELQTLDRLERDVIEAQRKARQQELQLTQWFNEFCAIPEKAARLAQEIEAIRSKLSVLDEGKLRAEFSRQFKDQCSGVQGRFDTDWIAATIVTLPERRAVLSELEVNLKAELDKLQQDNARLGKLLGRPKHKLTSN